MTKTWNVFLQGEDHTEFTIEVTADSEDKAYEKAEILYPESTILEVFDPVKRAEDIYRRANERYDNPDLDDYDY